MKFLSTLGSWIVSSSVNANKWSLTIKGILGIIVVGITYYFNFANIPFNNADLQAIVDSVVAVIQVIGLLATGIITLVGAIRKVYTTAKGTNAVINTASINS